MTRRTPVPPRRATAAVVVVEAVERRTLLSATLSGGVLSVTGTDGPDTIDVLGTVIETGPSTTGAVVEVTVDGTPQTFPSGTVTSVVVDAGDGNDVVEVDDDGPNTLPAVTVDGGAGDDSIAAPANPEGETLDFDGGDGNDTIEVDSDGTATATLTGGAGNDTITVGDDVTADVDGGDGDDLITLTSPANPVTIAGGAGTDTVEVDPYYGGPMVLDLDGLPDSTLYGSTPDVLDADIENLTVNGNAGPLGGLTVTGDALDNVIAATNVQGGVTLHGGDGNDRLTATGYGPTDLSGDGGDDTLVGTAGNTTFSGGAGTDVADFSSVADPLSIYLDGSQPSGTPSQISGGAADTFDGTVEEVYGGTGNDLLVGGPGPNGLFGGAGDDTLVANGGTDALFGGTGDDTLVARDGGATYVDGGGDGSDVADTDPAAVDTVTGVAVVNPGVDAGSAELAGTPFGTAGSYHGDGATYANAFDGDLDTYVDAADDDGSAVGLDLGSPKVVTQLSYAPRPDLPGRVDQGVFQASSTPDFSADVVTLFTITATPPPDVLTTVSTGVTAAYRYVRFVGPAGAYDNLAEMQVFGTDPGPTTGTVTGSVYADANGDGAEDGTDAGLAGQGVFLDVNGDGTEDAGDLTATTGSDGSFTIAAVPPGTYTVRQVLPAGYTQTTPAAGSYAVTVTAGTTATGNAFGDTPIATPTPTPTTTGTVGGTVFDDANGNGGPDPGEAGLAGVTVYLDLGGSGTPTAGDPGAVTDPTGAFTIAAIPVGTYVLRQVVPAGYTQTAPAAGSYTVTVADGAAVGGEAFGDEAATATPTPTPTPTPTLPAATLAVAVLTTPAAHVVGGTAATAKVRVTNAAAAAFAGPVTVRVYASADGTLSPSAVMAGAVTDRPLALRPSRSATVAVRFTYPASLASGNYRLVAAVTPTSGGAAVSQPATAVAGRAVAVAAPAVDLSVSLPGGATVRPGRHAAAAVRLTNAGNTVAVGSVTVTLYASTDGTADATAVLLTTVGRTVKIAAGKTAAVRLPFTAPASLNPGAYKLVAVIVPTTTPADDDAADDTAVAATR